MPDRRGDTRATAAAVVRDQGRREAHRPEESAADILAFYERARTATDQVISKVDLDEARTTMFGDTVSLRWALIHMLEATARHRSEEHTSELQSPCNLV